MKIQVDLERCQGYGNCAMTAPDVFAVDPATDKVVIASAVPTSEREEIAEAVRDCPTGALRIVTS